MYCRKCGTALPDDAAFCSECGTAVLARKPSEGKPSERKPSERKPSERKSSEGKSSGEKKKTSRQLTKEVSEEGRVTLCSDGKYRWFYEFPMFANPTILITVWKVMMLSGLAPALLVFFVTLGDGIGKAFSEFATVYGIMFGIITVLSVLGYGILALSYNGKYIVLFTMDETSVIHSQQNKQFKKAQGMAWLLTFLGAAGKNPGRVGQGLLVSSKNTTSSTFESVKSVIGIPRRNTIKVNETLSKNQVYVHPEDYEFVWEFITSRCNNASIKR